MENDSSCTSYPEAQHAFWVTYYNISDVVFCHPSCPWFDALVFYFFFLLSQAKYNYGDLIEYSLIFKQEASRQESVVVGM